MKHWMIQVAAALAFNAVATGAAQAQVKIGVVLSTTGPGATVGVQERNAMTFWPTEAGGTPLSVIVLDDRSDPASATTGARRLVTEDKVDVLVGSSLVPGSSAVSAVAAESETLHLMIAPTPIAADKNKWSFSAVPMTAQVASAVFEHITKAGVKSVGYIGYSDSWGDQWLAELKAYAAKSGVKIVAEERYARADTSVTGQALRVIAAKPDVVLVGGSASGAGLAHGALADLKFPGQIYHTHGAVSPDFIRIAGNRGQGALAPNAPTIVADQLPVGHPNKALGMAFYKAYEEKYGPGRPPFAPIMHDVMLLLQRVIPVALAKGQPGSKDFRAALRDAMENQKNVVAAQGIFNYSPTDHVGLDDRARVLVTLKDGRWQLAP